MNNKLAKHIIIRVVVSSLLLFLLHFAQIDYELGESFAKVGMNENAIAFTGALILLVWVIFMGIEVAKHFKIKLKWFAISNILIMVLTILGFFFIQILIALASC